MIRKGNWLSVILITIFVVAGLFVAPANRVSAAPPVTATWTIAVYCDSDNSLSGNWYNPNWGLCPQIRLLSANSKVNIVGINSDKPNDYALIDKISGGTVTRIETIYPKMNMGTPSTLSWWINYSTSH